MLGSMVLALAGCTPEEPVAGGLLPAVSMAEHMEAPLRVDRFLQAPHTEIDVLFVVDASEDQTVRDLLVDASALMAPLWVLGVDHHVGMTSSQYDGEIRWFGSEEPDPAGRLRQMIRSGRHEAPQRGLDTVRQALGAGAEEANRGFLREDAVLHTVLVADGEATDELTGEDFARWYRHLAVTESTFSVFVPDSARDARYASEILGGFQANAVADVDPDWVWPAFAGLEREFFLTRLPRSYDEVAVHAEDPRGAPAFYVHKVRNSVVLVDVLPEAWSEVHVSYAPRQ